MKPPLEKFEMTQLALPSLGEFFIQAGARWTERVALFDPEGTSLTYGELLTVVSTRASELRALGPASMRVAVVAPQGLELALTLLSVASAAVCLPLQPGLRKVEYLRALREMKADLVLTMEEEPELRDASGTLSLPCRTGWTENSPVSTEPPFTASGDPALLLRTSGTTGPSKSVALLHRNLFHSAHRMAEILELGSEDCCLAVMPFFHIHGFSTLLATLTSGGKVACLGPFSRQVYLSGMKRGRPTWYSASPTVHRVALDMIQEAGLSEHRLRFLRSASSPMPPSLQRQLERTFQVPVLQAYGMTETSPQIASQRLPPYLRKEGSVGQPVGISLEIRDPAGLALEAGRVGAITVSGRGLSPDCPEWYTTGDLGYLDQDGHLFITGRSKELINRGGVKLSPVEIEQAILEHPGVREAAVFPIPHPVLGEQVGAAVVLEGECDLELEDLLLFLRERLAPFKLPQCLRRLDRLPHNPGGKLQRGELVRQLASSPLEEEVRAIWGALLNCEISDSEQSFFVLGGHSLAAARLLNRYRDRFGVSIALEEIFLHPSVADQVRLIEEASKQLAPAEEAWEKAGDEPVPLTSPQRRLWFLQQWEHESCAYHMGTALMIEGPLQGRALEKALETVLASHPILRAVVEAVEGQAVQTRGEPRPFFLANYDLTARTEQERLRALSVLERDEFERAFKLERGELFRAALLHLEPQRYRLLLVVHHIVFDGWSWSVLLRELASAYRAACSPQLSVHPASSPSYFDYALHEAAHSKEEEALAFWSERLAGVSPVLQLPTDLMRKKDQASEAGEVSFVLGDEISGKLKGLESGVFSVLLSALVLRQTSS